MLDGKVALVTGAAGGIGEAMATVFTNHGANVIVCDVNDSDGMELAARLPRAVYQHLDVSNEDQWFAAVAAVMKSFGRLDILINNAGIAAVQSIEDTSRADFVRILSYTAQVDVNGAAPEPLPGAMTGQPAAANLTTQTPGATAPAPTPPATMPAPLVAPAPAAATKSKPAKVKPLVATAPPTSATEPGAAPAAPTPAPAPPTGATTTTPPAT